MPVRPVLLAADVATSDFLLISNHSILLILADQEHLEIQVTDSKAGYKRRGKSCERDV
jgi:hypothetical protein